MSVFSDLATVIAADAFAPVAPIITSTLLDIHANPGVWTNPISAPIKLISLQAQLVATLPTAQNLAIGDITNFLTAFWMKLGADLAAKAAAAQANLVAANPPVKP
jgi:hypothetical protein